MHVLPMIMHFCYVPLAACEFPCQGVHACAACPSAHVKKEEGPKGGKPSISRNDEQGETTRRLYT